MRRLWEKLTEYSEASTYPMHMPGHKRNTVTKRTGAECAGSGKASEESAKVPGTTDLTMPQWLAQMWRHDITEIDGFDDLHDATGIIAAVQEGFARLYGAGKACLLVNGSTSGNLAMIHWVVPIGGTLLVAGEHHPSVENALAIGGRRGIFLATEPTSVEGIGASMAAKRIEEALAEHPEIDAVLITSPTYDGVISDIEAMAGAVHASGRKLLVDGAHGAHLHFCDRLMEDAIACGADAVVMSLHKTLPSPTQTSVLLLGEGLRQEEMEAAARAAGMFQTTSPSYLLMGAMDWCLQYLEINADRKAAGMDSDFDAYQERLQRFYRERSERGQVLQLDGDVFGRDPGKILLVDAEHRDRDGRALAEVMRAKHGIEVERSGKRHVLLMTSVMDTEEGFARLGAALDQMPEVKVVMSRWDTFFI